MHLSQVWPDSQSDPSGSLLPTRLSTQTRDFEVDLLNRTSPHGLESAEDRDQRWVGNWFRHANVVTILSTLLLVTVATFFSHFYLTSRLNPRDILAFYLVRIRKFLGCSSGGAITIIALPATSFPKPLVAFTILLTSALWLASLMVGLGVVLLTLWIPPYADVDRPRHGLRSPGVVSAFLMRQGSLRNAEAIPRILSKWLLVAVFLFLCGLDIRLLHTANSPSPLVVLSSSLAFFVGQCLILAASADSFERRRDNSSLSA